MSQVIKELIKKGEISPLLTDNGEQGITKETNLLKYKNKRYVLRKCKNKERADRYEFLSKKFEKYEILPKLAGRYENDIIYEFIEGRDLRKKEPEEVISQVGEILAKINLEDYTEYFSYDYFEEFLIYLEFKKDDHTKLKDLFFDYVKSNTPKIRFDVSDTIPENFRIRDEKVYLVDIDSIYVDLRGAGIGKCFFKWFKDDENRKYFLRRYNRVSSSDFLTDSYLDMLTLNFIITSLKIKKKHGGETRKHRKLKKGFKPFLK